MLITKSLPHGIKYHYRIHKNKLEQFCQTNFQDLKKFMMHAFTNCPNHHFLSGPRSSILRFPITNNPIYKQNHEVALLARMGLESNYYEDAHTNVQMFMLSYDEKTIAMEIPIWIHPEEFQHFKELFKDKMPLTGHIDLLRIENNKIWVWDYKPNAHREKYATTQTYFYAYMLSKRTGIPLTEFMCGYFDDKNTYIFNPSKIKLADAIKNHESIHQKRVLAAHIKT
ncbi:MAG: PD-(D/E)XK nuclease family protein [Candidatus Woesearchaeota archaeon]